MAFAYAITLAVSVFNVIYNNALAPAGYNTIIPSYKSLYATTSASYPLVGCILKIHDGTGSLTTCTDDNTYSSKYLYA